MELINFFILRCINYIELAVNNHRFFVNYSKRCRVSAVILCIAWTIGTITYVKSFTPTIFSMTWLLTWGTLMLFAIATSRQYVRLIETLKNITTELHCIQKPGMTYLYLFSFVFLSVSKLSLDFYLRIRLNIDMLSHLGHLAASMSQMLTLILCSQIMIIFEIVFRSQRAVVKRITRGELHGPAPLQQFDSLVQSYVRTLRAYETFSDILSGSIYCFGGVALIFAINYSRTSLGSKYSEIDVGLKVLLYWNILALLSLALLASAAESTATAAARVRAALATLNYVIDEEGPLKTQVKLVLRVADTFRPCFGSRSYLTIDARIIPTAILHSMFYSAAFVGGFLSRGVKPSNDISTSTPNF